MESFFRHSFNYLWFVIFFNQHEIKIVYLYLLMHVAFTWFIVPSEKWERSTRWAKSLLILRAPWEHHPHSCSFIPDSCFSLCTRSSSGTDRWSWRPHCSVLGSAQWCVWLIPGAESQVRVSYFTHTYTLLHTEISTHSYTKKCAQMHRSNILMSVYTCIYSMAISSYRDITIKRAIFTHIFLLL